MSQFNLTDKVAIITGGRRGIGKAIALAFAEAGADIAVCDRNIEDGKLAAVEEEIKTLGRHSLAIATDVRSPEQVDNLVKQTVDKFGRVDILVNNAGGSFECPMEEMTSNSWDRLINLDLNGTFLCCKAAGMVMIQQKKGKIINISSVAGLNGSPTMAHYGAAKAGVINFTKSLALEWAQYNINVNCIAPGPIDTEGVRGAHRNLTPEQFEERKRAITRAVPLGRYGQPEDIAYPAIFLASEASSFITGETIIVSGGRR